MTVCAYVAHKKTLAKRETKQAVGVAFHN